MKLLKRLALGFGVLLGLIVVVVFVGEALFHNAGSQKLTDVTSQIDREDPGWRLNEIEAARQAEKPPDELNSAVVIVELHSLLTKGWTEHRAAEDAVAGLPTNRGPAFSQMVWLLQARLETRDFRNITRERLLKPELLARSGGCYPIQIPDNPLMTLLPHAQKAREIANLLDCDAKLAVLEGNPDRGIRSARAGLVAARSLGEEPFLISQLVRIACAKVAAQSAMQVLAWSQPKQGLTELQAELRTEADFPWLQTGLRGERAVVDKVFEAVESGKITIRDLEVMGVRGVGPLDDVAFKLYRGLLPGDHAKSLELLSAYIQVSKLPSHEQLAALKAIPFPPRPPEDFRYLVTNLMAPACLKVADASILARVELLTASTAIACERFRIANKRWPNSLDEIPRSILPEFPADPCDGKPIRYRKLVDGIAVFSVGVGTQDERARQLRRERGDPLADLGVGWKLWNPEERGLPPIAKVLELPDLQNP